MVLISTTSFSSFLFPAPNWMWGSIPEKPSRLFCDMCLGKLLKKVETIPMSSNHRHGLSSHQWKGLVMSHLQVGSRREGIPSMPGLCAEGSLAELNAWRSCGGVGILGPMRSSFFNCASDISQDKHGFTLNSRGFDPTLQHGRWTWI